MSMSLPSSARAPAAPRAARAGVVSTAPSEARFRDRYRAELARGAGKVVAACLTTALAPVLVTTAATSGPSSLAGRPPAPERQVVAPAPAGSGDPTGWIANARAAAATCPGLAPEVLLAIGRVETGLGAGLGPSAAGARGPMQFLPTTWSAYGTDGDGDGVADVMNPVDALHGASRLLCANGGAEPGRLRSAVWNYNHSDAYVDRVLRLARTGS
jgi:hypothetical protein